MKTGLRYARLSAAIVAALYSASTAHADNLLWNPSLNPAPAGSDNSGNWDTSTTAWADQTTSTNVPWSNTTPPNSAIFGTGPVTPTTAAAPFTITLASNITVQDITLNTAANGGYYNFQDEFDGGETLTLAGNVLKASAIGTSQFLFTNNINLTAGNHTITINDTPGDVPELTFNTGFSGSGGLTLDNSFNSSGYTSYGTLVLNADSNYTGGTTVADGRLVINTSNGLGTGAVTISNIGTLSLGGGGTSPVGNLTIANPITISRNTYTGGNAGNYTDALVASNSGAAKNYTFSGGIVVDSTDARVAADTSNVFIPGSITQGADIAAGTGVLDLDGDYSGFVTLSGDNTAYGAAGNAIQLINGVELHVSSEANLGGATSKLNLSGGTIDPSGSLLTSGFMTNFGLHNLSGAAINTGVDTETSNTFTVNSLSGVAIGERGTGTMNFNGTNTFTGTPFFDGGTVNVNGSTTFAGFATRSPVFNIASGATVTTTTAANSTVIIADSNSAGNPDHGTLNIASGATLADGGGLVLSNDINTAGTINNAGTLTVNNETWIGNDNVIPTTSTTTGNANSTATFNQTAGSTTVNNYFVVGRDYGTPQTGGATGAQGTATFSGGTFTKNGSGETSIGENANTNGTLTINGNAAFTISSGGGDFYIGHNGGTGTATLGSATQASTATLTTNGAFNIGYQNGATGTLTQYAGTTINSNNGGGNAFDIGDGGTSVGTFNMYGGTTTVQGETWVGSNSGTSVGNFNMTGGSYTGNSWFVVGRNGSLGTLDISGGTITRGGTQTGNENYVGEAGQTGSTMNVSGTGSVTFNTGQFWLGNGGTSVGTLNISQSGSVQVTNNWLAVSRNTSGGTASVINISGGTLTKTGSFVEGSTDSNGSGTAFTIGSGGASVGVVNQTGGVVSSAGTFIGENGTGTYNISAGTATFTNALAVGQDNSGKGTLNISGTGVVNAQTLTIAAFDAATGVVNLNGGTLSVAAINGGPSTSTSTLNLNGGTLEPTASTTSFLSGLTTANVQSGGAIINTEGDTVTIAQSLVAPTPAATPAGGLTKAGAGTLTLSGTNTYAGLTTVQNGSLVLDTNAQASVFSAAGANVKGGSLVFDYNGGADPIATVQSDLTTSYNAAAGPFTSGQIYSSTAVKGQYGLGYIDNASTGQVTVKYTLYGDTTLKGSVGLQDYNTVVKNFNTAQPWSGGNFHYGSAVGLSDYNDVVSNFNQSLPVSSSVVTALTVNTAQVTSKPALFTSAATPAATDLSLQVNVKTGDVEILAGANPVVFSGYDVLDASQNLQDSGNDAAGDPVNELLLSESAAAGGNPTSYRSSTNYKYWSVIQDSQLGLAEGQNNATYSATNSAKWDDITIPANGAIDLGDIYGVATNDQDLAFTYSEGDSLNSENPVTGPTFAGTVAYVGGAATPEPTSLAILGMAGVLGLRRRRQI